MSSIGTRFSNLYTAVDTPAKMMISFICSCRNKEEEPSSIYTLKLRGCVHEVCVFVCECVLGRSRVSQPLNLRLCLLQRFGFLTSPRAIKTGILFHLSTSMLRRFSRSPSRGGVLPLTPLDGPIFLTYPLHLGLQYVHLITT